jgi:hypothetical protein
VQVQVAGPLIQLRYIIHDLDARSGPWNVPVSGSHPPDLQDQTRQTGHGLRFDNAMPGTDSISLIAQTDTSMLPRQSPHLSIKEIDGQTIILDRPHGQLHELNATASYVWHCCDGRATITEIVSATAREFDADPLTVEQDVADILRQLESLQLIEWANAPA